MAPSSIARRGAILLVLAALIAGCETGNEASAGTSSDRASSVPAATHGTVGLGGSVAAGSPGSGGAPLASAPADTGPAGALEAQFEQVVAGVSPSVVVIQTSEGLGSGVVFDSKGDIVTNNHVVGTSTSFKVTTAAGEQLDASLVGTFAPDDLAVIHVSGGSLSPATFGDSTQLKVGEIVLAVGNPLGLQSSVTEGIVSALGRTVSEPGGAALPGVIQTSAAINPGNSGGALVNLASQVIGIPTLAATDPQLGGSAPGIGFAIPSSTASDIATQLVENGKVTNSHRAYLGIQAANVSSGQGVLIYRVTSGGPAETAGLKANELITAINDTPIPDAATLAEVLATLTPGQTADVSIQTSDGSTDTVQVTLGELPG